MILVSYAMRIRAQPYLAIGGQIQQGSKNDFLIIRCPDGTIVTIDQYGGTIMNPHA